MGRLRCDLCESIVDSTSLLRAPNPFDSTDTISGCPKCLGVSGWDEICDEPGCVAVTSCGFPTPQGYRRTCFKHSDFKE